MAIYKSRNPALGIEVFNKTAVGNSPSQSMTIEGTVNKCGFLGLVTFVSALITWNTFQHTYGYNGIQQYVIGGSILGFVVALIIIFNKTTAPYLAPVYCALQGLAVGGLSLIMESVFPGIVIQALILTFSILFSLLFLYKFRIIKATENFKLIVGSATAGIAIAYLLSFVGGFFGFNLPFIHDNSIGGILFSVFVVIIAALNLVVDFDFIEHGAETNAPKYMEWYGAFGLMVTIIWLYLEILRLLGKLRR